MTSSYVALDRTTLSDAAYVAGIDGNNEIINRVAGAFNVQEQSAPVMTARILAGALPAVGAVPVEVAAQNTATISAPSVNPRSDIIYIDQITGVVSVATGAEDASPSDPAVPVGDIPLARINLTTGTTTITNSILDDLRTTFPANRGAKGADIASAASITLGSDGDYFDITGTTQIDTISTRYVGARIRLHFDSNVVVSNAGNIVPPNALSSWTTATDEEVALIQSASNEWRVVGSNAINISAGQSTMETATQTKLAVVPGRQQYHPLHPKGWCEFDGTGTPAISVSENVTSLVDDGTGEYTINWATDFSSADYACLVTSGQSSTGTNTEGFMVISAATARVAGAISLRSYRNTNTSGSALNDVPDVSVLALGDQ